MEEIKEQNETQQSTTQPEEKGNKGKGRTFTQEEVDRIVRDRLERDRAKRAPAPAEPTEAEKREQAVTAKENRLLCRDYLSDNNIPMEVLDILDTSDTKEFSKRADMVNALLRAARGAAPLYSHSDGDSENAIIAAAFGKSKHTPKNFRSFK